MTRAEIITLQRQLKAAGYHITRIDGIYGPETATAYQAFLNYNTPKDVATPAPTAVKPWYLSRSVIGILVSLIAVITERMGWMVNSDELTILVMQLLEFGGLALAFIGTVRRRAPIDPSIVAPGVRYFNNAYPVPPDSQADKPAGPFGYQ